MATDTTEKKQTTRRRTAAKKDQPAEQEEREPTPEPTAETQTESERKPFESRFTPDERADFLRKAQELHAAGSTWRAAAAEIGVTEEQLRRWRGSGQRGAGSLAPVDLETENRQLRQAVATLSVRVEELELGGVGDASDLITKQRNALAAQALRIQELEAQQG